MMAELHKNITFTRIDSIGILTIDAPPENYLDDPEFLTPAFVQELSDDLSLKGIIIEGKGRHFSAGADLGKLKLLAQNPGLLRNKISSGIKITERIENLNIPVVASISGVCFGGGLEIALACHFRICTENALFAFPESNHDLMPGLGGSVRLPRLVGAGKAAEIILSGEMVNAHDAHNYNLVDYVVPAKELRTFSAEFLKKMTAGRDIDVIRSVMKSIHNSRILSYDKALEEETKLFCRLAIKNLPGKNGD